MKLSQEQIKLLIYILNIAVPVLAPHLEENDIEALEQLQHTLSQEKDSDTN